MGNSKKKQYFTVFNKNKAKPFIGKKCRFSNYGEYLISGNATIGNLVKIQSGEYPYVCGTEKSVNLSYQFCSPIETNLRPYKDFEELSRDAVKHGLDGDYFKIMGKNRSRMDSFGVALLPDGVLYYTFRENKSISFELLAYDYVWSDGAPCGVEEDT